MPYGRNFDAAQFQLLAVRMAGVLILYVDHLAPGVGATLLTCKMRALRRVALRAFHGGDRVELPIRRAAAARLTARGFPFQVRHFLCLRRRARARTHVSVLAAPRANALAVRSTEQAKRYRTANQLRCQVLNIQTVSRQNVARAQRIVLRVGPGIELFVDVDVQHTVDIA